MKDVKKLREAESDDLEESATRALMRQGGEKNGTGEAPKPYGVSKAEKVRSQVCLHLH